MFYHEINLSSRPSIVIGGGGREILSFSSPPSPRPTLSTPDPNGGGPDTQVIMGSRVLAFSYIVNINTFLEEYNTTCDF
jgi:hypothetical protein